MELSKVYNQWKEWACVVYSLVWCCDALWVYLDPLKIVEETRSKMWYWLRPQAWLKHFVRMGYIKWYTPVNSWFRIKQAIDKWHPIMCTSQKIDFTATNKSKDKITIFDDTKTTRHNWFIRWYRDGMFICRNSYGEKWWDKWDFYLPLKYRTKVWQMYEIW